jgi:hypothetical protein
MKAESWMIFKLGISRTLFQKFNVTSIVQSCRCGDYSTPDSYFGSQRFIVWTENRLFRLGVVIFFFSRTPNKFWESNLKLIILRGCANAGRLNFVRWRLIGLISEQVSPFSPHTNMRKGSHKPSR